MIFEDISPKCQIHQLSLMAEPLRRLENILQFRNRIKHMTKRRLRYISNYLQKSKSVRESSAISGTSRAKETLRSGELVRVKSRKEIQATLDRWNRLKGCDIMEEMWKYCDTTQRVYKWVEQFLDERDYLVKKCNGIYILEDVFCNGTVDFGRCDRTCFFFWREEWLEKI